MSELLDEIEKQTKQGIVEEIIKLTPHLNSTQWLIELDKDGDKRGYGLEHQQSIGTMFLLIYALKYQVQINLPNDGEVIIVECPSLKNACDVFQSHVLHIDAISKAVHEII